MADTRCGIRAVARRRSTDPDLFSQRTWIVDLRLGTRYVFIGQRNFGASLQQAFGIEMTKDIDGCRFLGRDEAARSLNWPSTVMTRPRRRSVRAFGRGIVVTLQAH